MCPGRGLERTVAAVMNVTGVIIDPREPAQSQGATAAAREKAQLQGVTAVARNPALDTLHEIDTLETLHPGGEGNAHNHSNLDLFARRLICFSVDFRKKDI